MLTCPPSAEAPPRRRHRGDLSAALPPEVPPTRRMVTPRALLTTINTELAARPECSGIRVGAGRWRTVRRPGECNWSEESLVLLVAGPLAAGALTEVRKAVARARARFDVAARVRRG